MKVSVVSMYLLRKYVVRLSLTSITFELGFECIFLYLPNSIVRNRYVIEKLISNYAALVTQETFTYLLK